MIYQPKGTGEIIPIPTLRDQFAMAALTGMLANPETSETAAELCTQSYLYADAMMAARKQNEKGDVK